MSEKSRNKFEEWTANHDYLGGIELHRGAGGDYADMDLQHAYESWEAAQSELTALREELSLSNKVGSAIGETLGRVTAERDDLHKRNKQLIELIQECVNVVRFGEDFDLPVTTMDRIDAALKPTESGASE
jgi:hypothetical protein